MFQTRPTPASPQPGQDHDRRRTRRTGTAAGRALLAMAVLVAATVAWVASAPPASAALGGYEIITDTSATDSTATKTAIADCTGTKKIVGGGGTVVGTGGGPREVKLTRLQPSDNASGFGADGYIVSASEITQGTPAAWSVRAYAVCVNSSAVGRWRIATATSTTSSSSMQFVAAPCGSGDDVFGTGASVGMAPGPQVGLQVARSDDIGSLTRAQAHEDVDGYSGLWNVTGYAICGAALDGYEIVSERSDAEGSEDTKFVSRSCPAGKVTVSAGGAVDGAAPGHVALTTVAPDRLGATVFARENLPLAESWDYILVRMVCANP